MHPLLAVVATAGHNQFRLQVVINMITFQRRALLLKAGVFDQCDGVAVEIVFNGIGVGIDQAILDIGLLLIVGRLAETDDFMGLAVGGVDGDLFGLNQQAALFDNDRALIVSNAGFFVDLRAVGFDGNGGLSIGG